LTWYSSFLIVLLSLFLISCNVDSKEIAEDKTSVYTGQQDELISSGTLSGLYRDAGPSSPVILIVPGSGPTDLNGNSPLGINSNLYKQISAHLANDGISTVRVDKRGMFSSASAGDPNKVTVEIYAEDYKNWVDVIQAKTNQACVYILGHSEGALMASAAAVDNADVCGIILVSGLGRPYGDVLREQLEANPSNKPILDEAFKAIEKLEQGQKIDSMKLHPALQTVFNPEVQGALISFMKVDPAKLAHDAEQRTLIIQGENDLQTSKLDAQKLADATNGKLILIEGVNHILKEAPADRVRNFATYQDPDLPVSKNAIEAIRDFVLQ
jgi:pimeloyl-ACP methyl ester carboxylesterase